MLKTQTVTEGQTISPFTFGSPPAKSVIVENYTYSFIYIFDAGLFIPPQSLRQIGLPSPQSTVTVLWQAPQNLSNPTPSGGTAILQWSDADVITTQAVPLSAFGINTSIPLGVVGHGSNANFALPPGCKSLLLTPPSGSLSSVYVCKVVGNTSSSLYGVVSIVGGGNSPLGSAIVPVTPALDPIVNVAITGSLNGIEVVALFDPADEPAPGIQTISLGGIPGGTGVIQPNGSNPYLMVQPRPSFKTTTGVFNLVVGTGQTVIAAPGSGSSLVLRKLHIDYSAAPAGAVALGFGTASGGASLGEFWYLLGAAANPTMPKRWDWDDLLVGDNLPLVITSLTGGNAFNSVLTVTYGIVTTLNWPVI
jgi:hypothetical protein